MILDLLLAKARFIVTALVIAAVIIFANSSPDVNVDDGAIWMSMTSIIALTVGGLASIFGMWVGRDKNAPSRNIRLMTLLITAAVFVGIFHSYLDSKDMIAKQADLERIMETIREIAIASGDTEIAEVMQRDFGVQIDIPEPAPEAEEADTGMAEEADTGAPADDAGDTEDVQGDEE